MYTYDPLTIAGVVSRWAAAKPDLVVLTVEGAGVRDDETRTYAELWDKGRSLAAGLRKLGLQPGDRLATLLANHAEFVDLMVAVSLLGAALVPIDPRTRGDKLIYMLSAGGCKAVVAADYALTDLLSVRENVPGLQWVVGLPTDEGKATAAQLQAVGVRPYGEVAGTDHRGVEFPGSQPETTLELIYTSGTTGDPKGIVMTQRRYCENAKLTPFLLGFKPDERLYSGLSLTHANAQVITLGTALVNAIPCVLSRRFSKSIPIIYFSVKWWNTLHQGSTIKFDAAPSMATTMLIAMLIMTFAFWAYSFAVVFTRVRAIVLEQESDTEWVRELVRLNGDVKR